MLTAGSNFIFFKAPVKLCYRGGPGHSVGELEALPGGRLPAMAVGDGGLAKTSLEGNISDRGRDSPNYCTVLVLKRVIGQVCMKFT